MQVGGLPIFHLFQVKMWKICGLVFHSRCVPGEMRFLFQPVREVGVGRLRCAGSGKGDVMEFGLRQLFRRKMQQQIFRDCFPIGMRKGMGPFPEKHCVILRDAQQPVNLSGRAPADLNAVWVRPVIIQGICGQ